MLKIKLVIVAKLLALSRSSQKIFADDTLGANAIPASVLGC